MANKVYIILNTHGGILNSQTKTALVEKGMQATGVDYHLAPTQHAEHAIELAKQAALDGYTTIVAAGGDGTINEVLNGFMSAAGGGELATLGLIPFGTANDLYDMLELPRDMTMACQRIAAGQTRLIDVGIVNGRYFVNNSAIGLEPIVTLEHDKLRRIKGNIRYIVAALKSIASAQSWNMKINWKNGIYDGPVVLVSVGNSARTGGSFYLTPAAKVDDGILDFVFAADMSRFQMLKLLPQTFSGKHIHHPLVTYLQTTSLSISVSPPTPIQADGQIIDETATEITYRILPQKLRVIV